LGSTISHELRQPLTAVCVNTELGLKLLDGPYPDIAEARSVMRDVLTDAGRAAATIEQIRSMLRRDNRRAIPVDVNEIVQQVASLLERDARARGVRFELATASEPARVHADTVELRQMVLNLAINALDAVMTVSGQRSIAIGTRAAGDWVELFVRDTGPGLPLGAKSRIFEPFFTTKEHGLGMGLAIVRSLVERHGGSIAVETHAEGGAVFRVVMPSVARMKAGASRGDHAALTDA
jgi:C4-dicarboxylate-specific signal transduction histidine kinase